MLTTQPDRPRAVLVGLQLPGVTDEEHAADLAELTQLVTATTTDGRDGLATARWPGSGTVLGSGKLKELAKLTGGPGIIASSDQTGPRETATWSRYRAGHSRRRG